MQQGSEFRGDQLIGRILGIDYGERRIGIAISDPLGITAQGLETLVIRSRDEALEKIAGIAEEKEAVELVVGMPLNMDGSTGIKVEEVKVFVEALKEKTGLKINVWDERMTTIAAQRAMGEMGIKLKGRKKNLDRIAATMILQGYLDRLSRSSDDDKES